MIDDINYKSLEKNKTSYRLVTVEKGYGGRLSTLGKITCFAWYLDRVEITEEDMELAVPLENITKTVSFAEGYRRAKCMIDFGFNKSNYNDFLEKSINPKEKEAIERVLEAAYGRSQNNARNSR